MPLLLEMLRISNLIHVLLQALAADLVLRIQPGLTRLPPSALVSVVEASGLLLGPSARPLWVQAVTFVVEQVTPR
jgi:hypothetical protein